MTPIKKDAAVVALLDRLENDLGTGVFDIVDHWGDDAMAIGIGLACDHRVLAYISTDPGTDRFSYELELPPTDAISVYSVAATSSDCSYSQLLVALRMHWNLGE